MHSRFELGHDDDIGRFDVRWLIGGLAAAVALLAAALLAFGARGADEASVTSSVLGAADLPAEEQIPGDEGATTATDEDILLAALRGELESAIGDSYAGVWLDDGREIRIGATTAEAAAQIEALGVPAEIVEYSEADLDRAVASLNESAPRLSGLSTGWFVDLVQNRVVIETDDEAAVGSLLPELGVDTGMVVFAPAVERSLTAELDSSEYWTVPGVSQCSFGFGVVGGFITAGHCIPDDWTNDLELSTTVRGTVVHDIESEFSDAAFVRVDAPNLVGPGVPDGRGGTTPVLGFEEAPVGAQVCKYGKTTGQTCGVVRSRNQTIHTTETKMYTGQVMTTACARPGDSGGRLMWGNHAQGVTSTGQLAECGPNGEGQSSFQPIKPLLARWGLQLTTADSFLAPPEPQPQPDPFADVPELPGQGSQPDNGDIPVLPGEDGGPGAEDIPVLPGIDPAPGGGDIPTLPGPDAGTGGADIPVLPPEDGGSTGGVIPVLPAPTPTAPAAPPPDSTVPAPTPDSTVPVLPPPDSATPVLPAPTPALPGFFGDPGPFQLSSFIPIQDCMSLDGSNVVLTRDESCRTEVHAMFRIEPAADGNGYLITGNRGGQCWTVDGGVSVVMSPCVSGMNQRFTITETNHGYKIQTADLRCVEIHGGRSGWNVGVWECLTQNIEHQRWGSYHYPHLD